MKNEKNHIRDRFPENKHTFDQLTAKDPEFVSLCEDYDACVNALRYWSKSKEDDTDARVTEYRTLVWELQEEIHQMLIAASQERSKG